MVTALLDELERAGVRQRPELIAADAGYWNEQHIDEIVANKHIPVLVAPDKGSRGTPRKTWTGGRYDWMRAVLQSEHGGQRYRKRRQTVEPVFGHTKHNKGMTRFLRRGRMKVRTEWRLHMTGHNLTKLYNHQTATQAA
jgi:Transposase DDE domain